MAAHNGGPADPWTAAAREKFASKPKSEFFDPCQEAASRSIRCLHRNNGDRSMCQDYFDAYRECKKQWIGRRREPPPSTETSREDSAKGDSPS